MFFKKNKKKRKNIALKVLEKIPQKKSKLDYSRMCSNNRKILVT